MQVLSGNVQLIGSDGRTFKATEVDDFLRELPPRSPCKVVSIIGPQSTGKSYLLNHLFGTNFQVMDGATQWGQTTQGIWIAKCINPSMIIIDVEGSDATKRADHGTSFQNRSALFALTISDIMLFNMPLRDVGKYEGGCVPLLELIFRERLKLDQCKTRVVVVLRDCNDITNSEREKEREKNVIKHIKKIWRTVHSHDRNINFGDYIELSVLQLPFPDSEVFGQKCGEFREKLSNGGLMGPRELVFNALEFSSSTQRIWNSILQIKNLNIPSLNVMQSTYKCKEIVDEKIGSLNSNKDFLFVMNMEDSTSPSLFKTKLQEFLNYITTEYDLDAIFYDSRVKDEFRNDLKTKIIIRLKSKCGGILKTNVDKIFNEKKKAISSTLETKNISIEIVIRPHVDIFVQSCEGFPEEYTDLVTCYHLLLERCMKEYAISEVRRITQRKRGTVIFIGVVASTLTIGIGIGAVCAFGLPAVAAFLAAFAAWLKSVTPAIIAATKVILRVAIVPAVMAITPSLMEYLQKEAPKHSDNLLIYLPLTMVVLLLKHLTSQPSGNVMKGEGVEGGSESGAGTGSSTGKFILQLAAMVAATVLLGRVPAGGIGVPSF